MGDSTSPDAVVYAEVLARVTEGYALYAPHAGGVVGDCGILLEDGQFVTLFNCFTDGIGGKRLPTPEPNPGRIPVALDLGVYPEVADASERRVQVRSNEGVAWRVHKGRNWSVELELPIPLPFPEVGFGFQASHTNGMAAFLVPCGASRRVETFLKNNMFPQYLHKHHREIRTRYASYKTQTIYIVEGTTHATDWCRGVARQHGREVKGYVSVSPITMAGIPSYRVRGGRDEVIDHPWTIEKGPMHQRADGRLHLISAKLTVRRSRLSDSFKRKPSPTTLNQDVESPNPGPQGAGATPGPSRPSYNLGDASGYFSTGSGGSSSGTEHQQNSPSRLMLGAAAIEAGLETDTSGTDTSSDTSSIDQPLDRPNAIEALLDEALIAHPQFDAIIAGWAVLEEFWTSPARYDTKELTFDVEEMECSDGRVARLLQISSRGRDDKSVTVGSSLEIANLNRGNDDAIVELPARFDYAPVQPSEPFAANRPMVVSRPAFETAPDELMEDCASSASGGDVTHLDSNKSVDHGREAQTRSGTVDAGPNGPGHELPIVSHSNAKSSFSKFGQLGIDNSVPLPSLVSERDPPPTNARKKHVGRKCVECHESHQKCDNNRPCKRCTDSREECIDSTSPDLRRRPTASQLREARNRIKELEAVIQRITQSEDELKKRHYRQAQLLRLYGYGELLAEGHPQVSLPDQMGQLPLPVSTTEGETEVHLYLPAGAPSLPKSNSADLGWYTMNDNTLSSSSRDRGYDESGYSSGDSLSTISRPQVPLSRFG